MAVWNITKANLIKKKGTAASIFILIAIATLLIHSSFGVIMNLDQFFVRKTDELNSPHYFTVMNNSIYKDSYIDFFKQDSRIKQYESESIIYMNNVEFDYGGSVKQNIIVFNADNHREIAPIKWTMKSDEIASETAIYLPYYAKLIGYGIGDEYKLQYKNKEFDYQVAGFYESTEMHTLNSGAIKHFLNQDAFENLYREIGGSICISVRLTDVSQSENLRQDFRNYIDTEMSTMGAGSIDMAFSMTSLVGTETIRILVSLFIAFSFIIVVVTLMMIAFHVSNGIEDNMVNIGILGGTGYTSGQIIASMMAEYGFLALIGCMVGLTLSHLLMPALNGIMISISGIIWEIPIPVWVSLLTCALMVLLILAAAYISARKIRKLPPVVALRGGMENHSFKKNALPLHKGIGGLHFRLGCKNIIANRKMYLTLSFILTGITFVVVAVTIACMNFIFDRKALIEMSAFEYCNVSITASNHTDCEELVKEIESMDTVRKTSMTDYATIRVDGLDITGYISDDFTKMETLSVYEGSMPIYDNEIVITGVVSDQLKKGIGDFIEVKAGGVIQDYLITGFTQTASNGGKMGFITLAGYQKLVPDYQRRTVNVYLNKESPPHLRSAESDGVITNDFILELENTFGVVNGKKESEAETAESPPHLRSAESDVQDKYANAKRKAEEKISAYLSQYGVDSVQYAVILNGEMILSGSSFAYKIEEIINYDIEIEAMLGGFINGFTLLMYAISIAALVIIALILFMIVNSIIVKHKMEFGIMKANGYTAKELMFQLAVSFLPISVCAVSIGTVLGAKFVNPMFSVLFYSAGISKLSFTLSPVILLLVDIIMIVVTFVLSMLAAYRIKNIAVCELLSE